MREVIAAIGLTFLAFIPGSAFAYWVPDSGPGIGPGPGLPGPQGGYLGDNPGPSLPWLGNVLSGIFGAPGNPYASVYGGYLGYYHPGPYSCSWYHPYPTWQQGQTSDIQIYGSGNTVGVTQGQGQGGAC